MVSPRRKIGRTRALKAAKRALSLKPAMFKVRAERRGRACSIVVRERGRRPQAVGTDVARWFAPTWAGVAEKVVRHAARLA